MRSLKINSVDDLSDFDIDIIFNKAKNKYDKKFSNNILLNAFFEPSTRTKLSFEIAALRLDIKTITFDIENSSLKKGENEEECVANLLALNPDILVIRSANMFYLHKFNCSNTVIINAGNGIIEHPTQSLIDVFTLLQYWQVDSLQQKNIVIVGDICHSRVARSDIKLMSRLGAKIILVSPKEFSLLDNLGQYVSYNSFADIDDRVDALIILRIQKERINNHEISDQQYYESYGLSLKRFLSFKDNTVLLHPGPMNIGIEIDREVAYHHRSLILRQVNNSVPVRSALLAFCLD